MAWLQSYMPIPGLIVEAWLVGLFRACVTSALAYEYTAALSNKLSYARWQATQPALGGLLRQADYVTVHYSWRPLSPDPGDDHVIDCAMNAAAPVITANVRDFKTAEEALGLQVMTPVEFVTHLVNTRSRD